MKTNVNKTAPICMFLCFPYSELAASFLPSLFWWFCLFVIDCEQFSISSVAVWLRIFTTQNEVSLSTVYVMSSEFDVNKGAHAFANITHVIIFVSQAFRLTD